MKNYWFLGLVLVFTLSSCPSPTSDGGGSGGGGGGGNPPSDTTPPTVGTSITFASTTTTSTQVSWGAATDDATPQASLQYKLVRALNAADIDTVAEADAISGSNLILNWTANVTSHTVSGLSVNTTYWFAVLVKDGANNIALYNPQSVTTNDANLEAVEVLSPTGTSVNPVGLAIVVRFNKSLDTTVKGWLEYDHVPRRYMENPPKFDPTTMDRLRISATITFSTTNVPNDTVTFTPLYGYGLQTYANPKVGGFSPASGLAMSGHSTLTHSFSTTHIPLTNELIAPLDKWNDQNIYFLLTDRFNDGDTTNNQFIMSGNMDYTLGDGKFYQGGDFVGLKNKMTYLQNLGVTAIWITAPVMQAWENATWTSYHGYWAQDFLAVDPHLGTMKDFREMVQEAHNKGIKVIMDIVINHTASLFYYDLNSNNNPDTGEWEPSYNASSFYSSAKWLDSFSWALKANRRPPYFGSGVSNLWDFYYRKGGNATTGSGDEVTKGDFAGLRDVNTEDTSVRAKMKEIFKWWIANTNIDGFRIDTVKHVEGSFWTEFCNEIRTWAKTNHNKDFFMIAEVYDGSASNLGAYTHSNRLDSVLGFHMADEVFDWNSGDNITVFKDNGSWAARPKTITIQNAFNTITAEANLNANSLHTSGDGLTARQKIGYFIDNHDLNRFLNDTSGISNKAPSTGALTNLRLALSWMYTWEGIPVLYYGTEQNYMQTLALTSGGEHGNGAGNVNKGNRPNLWQIANSTQGNTPWNESHDTFNWIKGLIQLRKQYPALRRGVVSIRWVDDGLGSTDDDGILAFLRKGNTVDEDILIVINTNPSANKAPSAGSGNDLGLDWPVGTVLEVVPIPGFMTSTDTVYNGTTWVTTTTTFSQPPKTSAAWFQLPPNSVRILKKQGYNP
jgi:alpha-amylase